MKTSLLALGLMAALPFAASAAENISYNYVEGDYVNVDPSGRSSQGVEAVNAEGWGIKGSYAVLPNLHVFGGYSQVDYRDILEHKQWNLGVGYNYEIAKSTDLLARVAYENLNANYFDKKFNGWSAEAGINNSFGPHVSTYLLAGYEDYAKRNGVNLDGAFYGRLGGQVNFTKNWALSGDVKMYTSNGDVIWSVGPRFSW